MFSIYYMNFQKAYEIKTMLSNVIAVEKSVEHSRERDAEGDLQAKLGLKAFQLFDVSFGSDIKGTITDSDKVLDSFKVVMTKSLILNEVMSQCKDIDNIDETVREGELIKINNVSLSLNNESDIRAMKMLSNGLLKGLSIPQANGLDINNVFSSIVFDAFEYTNVEEQSKAAPSNLEPLSKPRKIVDLEEQELDAFFQSFDSKLYGHARFKTDFKQLIASFRVFNRIGEHKILSLFLMGDSGVGKTEVARSIHKALGGKTKLAKINFGNYSSHDALNSLIGSPRGYVGSENGELIKRVKDSDIGLILIDEFEKADTPVFNYFLDVLENGKITDSQGDEYDADGYIIVFTSNMTPEEYKQKISPELKSRLDYKGIFNLLTDDDKTKYMHYRVNQIIDAYRTKVDQNLPEDIHEQIVSQLNVSKYKNMRDLNKDIKDLFVRTVSIANE